MDVDSELDQDLLTRFNALGTTDRDILITELQRLLNFQLSQEGCVFFLDMTNWNLQAAVGAYYDFNSSQSVEKLPCMEFFQDITIGEGEAVPPSTRFIKTWRLKNNGTERWPPGVFLKFTYGDQLGPITFLLVNAVEPSEYSDVSVEMISPATNGIYQAQWRMCTPMGQYFGDIIWVIISVSESGLLGVTQQLSELGHESRLSPIKQNEHRPSGFNPFSYIEVPPVPFNSPVKPLEQEVRNGRRNSHDNTEHTNSSSTSKDGQ